MELDDLETHEVLDIITWALNFPHSPESKAVSKYTLSLEQFEEIMLENGYEKDESGSYHLVEEPQPIDYRASD